MAQPLMPRIGKRGSPLRPGLAGDYRSIVAVGGPTFTSVANAASGTMTFSLVEPCILDRLVLMAGAAIQLVAGADSALGGSYVTAISLNGDSLVSGNVAATIFHERSNWSPAFGHTCSKVDALSITVLNESGAVVEYGAAFSVR